MPMICPGCDKPITGLRNRDLDTAAILYHGDYWHRTCHLRGCRKYDLINALFQAQDEPLVDPQSAMVDIIADLGHFCAIHNSGKRGAKRIDFEDAVRVGLGHYQEEC